ncbi:MAG: Epimerase [Betaproteobacteria bacterium]|nr:Epimerase [Betaproteobacteria bacterium]
MTAPQNRRVLITGSAGEIGCVLRAGLYGGGRTLRLFDIKPQAARPDEEVLAADIGDTAALAQAMHGIDCVVHLAGVPREGAWDAILPNNIIGTYNVFEAARNAGVKRVIFASSNHVIGYYRATEAVGISEPERPDSRYGVSKAYGEALGRLYADKYGLEVACLRIGSFRARPQDARQLATWISHRDMVELVRCCIDAAPFHFLVLYGVSNNARNRWQNPDAATVGYRPLDNAEQYAAELETIKPSAGDPAADFHGGAFCALEFTGDARRID